MAGDVGGGVVAIRGFAYQFDQTILAILDRPGEDVVVEHVEDLNGVDWCIQTKQYSNKYAHSVLSSAIESLWKLHRTEPARHLRLHCHFKDKPPGSSAVYDVNTLPATWRKKLKVGKSPATAAEEKAFLDKLTVHYTHNLEDQFLSLVNRIQKDFGKRSQDDAVATHAVLRAHVLELSTRKKVPERRVNLAALKAVDQEHRAHVLEHGHAELIGEERYVKLVASRLFPSKLNLDAVERAFVIDVGATDDLGALQALVVRIATRYFRRYKTGTKGRSPVVCVRGLTDDQYREVMHHVHDALYAHTFPPERTTDLPLVDGHAFFGSSFRLASLQKAGETHVARVRVLPPNQLTTRPVIDWLSSMAHVYHLRTEAGVGTLLPIASAKRVYAKDVAVITRMLA